MGILGGLVVLGPLTSRSQHDCLVELRLLKRDATLQTNELAPFEAKELRCLEE